jgi:hypothetical protein
MAVFPALEAARAADSDSVPLQADADRDGRDFDSEAPTKGVQVQVPITDNLN